MLLAYDIGGTKVECALFSVSQDLSGEGFLLPSRRERPSCLLKKVISKREKTERRKGYDHLVTLFRDMALSILKDTSHSVSSIKAIGAGIPGSVDPSTQKMVGGSVFSLIDKDLSRDLCEALDVSVPFRMDNDANCFALAESLCGAGRPFLEKTRSRCVGVGVILGTGLGGGLIVNGEAVSGALGGGGEIGHSLLFAGGHPCYCGRRGCAEQYLSGPALEALFATRAYSQVPSQLKAPEIFSLMNEGEPVAKAVIIEWKKNLAVFLGNLASILNPSFFVLGGGLSLQPVLYEGLAEEVRRNSFLSHFSTPVLSHVLGDSSGIVGAALLAEACLNDS